MTRTEVTKEEYEEFVKNYPRKLHEQHVCFVTPSCIVHYDYTIGRQFDGVVAIHSLDSDLNGHYGYTDEVDHYEIWK